MLGWQDKIISISRGVYHVLMPCKEVKNGYETTNRRLFGTDSFSLVNRATGLTSKFRRRFISTFRLAPNLTHAAEATACRRKQPKSYASNMQVLNCTRMAQKARDYQSCTATQ
jgi:hypothetical protein